MTYSEHNFACNIRHTIDSIYIYMSYIIIIIIIIIIRNTSGCLALNFARKVSPSLNFFQNCHNSPFVFSSYSMFFSFLKNPVANMKRY
jgi:hypothetical protein